MASLSQFSHQRIAVRVEEDVGEVRRALGALAEQCPALSAGEVALVATELASNIVRHTQGGYVLFRLAADGVELLAIDHGPGMRNVWVPGREHLPPRVESLPGRSRSRGLGVGLAGVARLATVFDLYSNPDSGTVVLASLAPEPPAARWYRAGAVNVAIDGSAVSGDAWAVTADGSLAAVVVDGLGHGPEAAQAAAAAVGVFGDDVASDIELFVVRAHEVMRGTRGGMLAAYVIDPDRGELRFTGVGNVVGRLLSAHGTRSLACRDGSIGTSAALARIRVQAEPWGPGDRLVVATDGLRTHWEIDAYPGLIGHHPAVVAATLARDHGRATDDVAVLVVEDMRRER